MPFFETWMQTCMPEEGKILNPDHPCFWPDSTKVESLVALLNNSSEMKLVSVAGCLVQGWWRGQAKTLSLNPPHTPRMVVFLPTHPLQADEVARSLSQYLSSHLGDPQRLGEWGPGL